MRIAMGMLCFNRPIHTALTIAFALHNKADVTDFFGFYGIHENQEPPSKQLDAMLKDLQENCGFQYYYMGADKPNNVQGNVDTLMGTLNSLPGYACFCKIDDDVLIGHGSDTTMGNIILTLENENVMMLMGQAVPEHMRRSNPFCWEARVNNHRVVQRSNKACPMETYTFVSKKCLSWLRQKGLSISCDNSRGTYGPLTRKLINTGARVCLALSPAILMQHIGLTTTIEEAESVRSWAPARSWDPMDQVIQLPRFVFPDWVASHTTGTEKDFAIRTLDGIAGTMPEQYKHYVPVLRHHLEIYVPEPKKPKKVMERTHPVPVKAPPRPDPVFIPRKPAGTILRKLQDGRVVRSPSPVNRVVIRQTP